jgi:hypothetical protein
VGTEPGTPRVKASALPPSTPAHLDANTTPPAYLPPSSSPRCQRRAHLEAVRGDLAVGGGLTACQVTAAASLPAATHLWAPRATSRFFVKRTCASGEPLVGTKSSHLGSLWKEDVPPASRLWTARAAVSVLCGKNLCPCLQVASHL